MVPSPINSELMVMGLSDSTWVGNEMFLLFLSEYHNSQEPTIKCSEAVRRTKSQKLNIQMPGTRTRTLGRMMLLDVLKSEPEAKPQLTEGVVNDSISFLISHACYYVKYG